MKVKRIVVLLVVIGMIFCMSACAKKCANGCGNPANPECWADMCDYCCAYWRGLNGCRANH